MDNNTLYHYGVLGMRWGRRKGNTSPSTNGSKRRSKKSEDHIRVKSLKKKKLSHLSNDELRELNNRMQLENQYKNLKKQNISKGKKFVQDVMYDASKELVKDSVKRQAKPYVDMYSDKCVATGTKLVKMALGKN